MANSFNRYLNNTPDGPKGHLANFQHATDVFVENFYRLAPRFKFLFYAYFELDTTIPQVAKIVANKNEFEIPLLVKSTSLPSFTYDTVVKNRYNRKKVVYKQQNYEPITFVFHDDNAGIMNALWYAHNEYYSNDMLHTSPTDWSPDNKTWSAKKYGMDTITDKRFFKRITLYTMSRQKFNSYTLWGPKIKSWKHGDLDYSATDTLDNTMTIEFEGVSYSSGDVTETTTNSDGSIVESTMDGFATVHYDTVHSPLTTGDNGNAQTVMESVPEPNYFASPPNVNNVLVQAQQENRIIPLPQAASTSNVTASDLSPNLVSGIIGVLFPGSTDSGIESVATPKVFNGTFDSEITSPLFSGTVDKAPTINDL